MGTFFFLKYWPGHQIQFLVRSEKRMERCAPVDYVYFSNAFVPSLHAPFSFKFI
jgi:hypothetical protein